MYMGLKQKENNMRIETITKTYALFNELTDEQKRKVIELNKDINIDNDSWFEVYKNDFEELLSIIGFKNIKSYFTGFWSQGDGASFDALFEIPSHIDEIRARLKRLDECMPKQGSNENLKFHNICERLFMNANEFKELLDDDINEIHIYQQGRYCHSNTMYCDYGNMDAFLSECKELADYYYKMLERGYDDLQSDECIIETIECNELEFCIEDLENV